MADVDEFIKNALEVSVLLQPTDYALSDEQIKQLATAAGFKRGEIGDAIKRLRQGGQYGMGQLRLIAGNSYTLSSFFGVEFEPDFRDIEAFEFVRRYLMEMAREEGEANAKASRQRLIAEGENQGLQPLNVSAAITVMLLDGILEEKAELIQHAKGKLDWPTPKKQASERGTNSYRYPNVWRAKAYELVQALVTDGTKATPAKPEIPEQPSLSQDVRRFLKQLLSWERELQTKQKSYGDLKPNSIAEHLGWDAPRINRVIGYLEEQDFVAVRRGSGTAPYQTMGVKLTPSGWAEAEQEKSLNNANQTPGGNVAQSTPGVGQGTPSQVPTCDVVIVCALKSPELEKVRDTGKTPWAHFKLPNDPHDYYRSVYISKKDKQIQVVAAAANVMGMAASAILTTKMIINFRPKLVAMVGIAAGAKQDKQEFGDILLADQTFDYGAGKLKLVDGKFELEPGASPLSISTALHQRLLSWRTNERERTLHEILCGWRASKPRSLAVHIGPVASGGAVLDTRKPIEEAQKHWRKLVGVEMEAHAVHRACHETSTTPPTFLCAKSICDFAIDKADDWQPYAAYTAAQFCYHFLIEEWETLVQE